MNTLKLVFFTNARFSHQICRRNSSVSQASVKLVEENFSNSSSDSTTSNETVDGPISAYRRKVESGQLQHDDHQTTIVQQLEDLHVTLQNYTPASLNEGWLSKTFGFNKAKEKNVKAPKGLYLHGNVGTGKTMLMDMFFKYCKVKKKQRVHFHKFMLDVHKRIHAIKQTIPRQYNVKKTQSFDPIPPVAKEISSETWLLCFDEFQVTDIADAVILKKLFTELFDAGVVVVSTSNRQPDDLYKNGLQRGNFVPFIDVLKKRCNVLCLDSKTDYRMNTLPSEGTYFLTTDADVEEQLDTVFQELVSEEDDVVQSRVLEVLGRKLRLPVTCGKVLDTNFEAMCCQALGAVDYLELSKVFDTVILRDVPQMTLSKKTEARRFITLVDTFYDNQVSLICSAEAKPKDLFTSGNISQKDYEANRNLMDDLGINERSDLAKASIFTGEEELFAFERTVSRLTEMQTAEYWALRREENKS